MLPRYECIGRGHDSVMCVVHPYTACMWTCCLISRTLAEGLSFLVQTCSFHCAFLISLRHDDMAPISAAIIPIRKRAKIPCSGSAVGLSCQV